MLWRFRTPASFFVLLVSVAPACMPKKRTDAELNYAVGGWWKDTRSGLLLGVKEKRSVTVCLNSQGRVDSFS